MTQVMVFGLLVGWLGGWGARRMHDGMGLRGAWIGVPRIVSWACGLALAAAGLWRVTPGVGPSRRDPTGRASPPAPRSAPGAHPTPDRSSSPVAGAPRAHSATSARLPPTATSRHPAPMQRAARCFDVPTTTTPGVLR